MCGTGLGESLDTAPPTPCLLENGVPGPWEGLALGLIPLLQLQSPLASMPSPEETGAFWAVNKGRAPAPSLPMLFRPPHNTPAIPLQRVALRGHQSFRKRFSYALALTPALPPSIHCQGRLRVHLELTACQALFWSGNTSHLSSGDQVLGSLMGRE